MAKKVVLANPCGKIADLAFDAGSLNPLEAWFGVTAYAFQIYFDFSGYSDMAIGLGLMLGIVLAIIISAVGIPMPPPPNSNLGYTAHIQIVPTVLLTSFAVGVSATILASILPARHLSRIPVVEALRQNL